MELGKELVMKKRLNFAIAVTALLNVLLLCLLARYAHAQVDLAALKVELATDPKGLGLTQYTEKDSGIPAALLNDRNGKGAGPVPNDALNGSAILANIDPDEYINLGHADPVLGQGDPLDIQRLHVLLTLGSIGGSGIALGYAKALAIFTKLLGVTMPKTAANLQALSTRQGSRAEVLFGTGVSVSPEQVAAAWRTK